MVYKESGLCNFQEVSLMQGVMLFMSAPIGGNSDMQAGAQAVSVDHEIKDVLTMEQEAGRSLCLVIREHPPALSCLPLDFV